MKYTLILASLLWFGLATTPIVVEVEVRDVIFDVLCEQAIPAEIAEEMAPLYHRCVEPLILISMHYIESRFDTLAISRGGDCGIGQINPIWWSGKQLQLYLSDQAITDASFGSVVFSLEGGILYSDWILRIYLIDSDNDMRLALKKYNGSWTYSNKVMERYELLKRMAEDKRSVYLAENPFN